MINRPQIQILIVSGLLDVAVSLLFVTLHQGQIFVVPLHWFLPRTSVRLLGPT